MRCAYGFSILVVAALTTATPGRDEKREVERPDALLFRQADVRTDTRSLLAFLRQFTPTPQQRKRIATLVRRLGDDDPSVRDKSVTELTKLGPAAASALQRATADSDVAIRRAARRCLGKLGVSFDPELHEAAARRLGGSGSEEAIPILLAYLPDAPDAGAREVAAALLASLHIKRKEPVSAVVTALKDDEPCRRAAACRALGPAHAGKHLPALRALIKDADPEVRLHAAGALVRGQDRAGVPALVALLKESPLPLAWRAEGLLRRIAGARAPALALQGTKESRADCHTAWAKWFKDAEAKIDLSAVPLPRQKYLAYTDLGEGWLVVLDSAWKQVWKMEGLSGPTDMQFLPSGRVLIAENHAGKVTERDESGKCVWQHKPASYPISCWRLNSGNTVIVSRKELCEVTPEGKTVWSRKRKDQIRFARRLRDGRIALLTASKYAVTLDSTGREVSAVQLENLFKDLDLSGPFSVLPGGRYLVADDFRVREFDQEGRQLHELFTYPRSPLRLDNGHTILADHREERLVELDRAGKIVREHKTEGYAWHVQVIPR
jgi:HEAT repeat protein